MGRNSFAFQISTARSSRVRRLILLCWRKTHHKTSTTHKLSGLSGRTALKLVTALFEPNRSAKTHRRITLCRTSLHLEKNNLTTYHHHIPSNTAKLQE